MALRSEALWVITSPSVDTAVAQMRDVLRVEGVEGAPGDAMEAPVGAPARVRLKLLDPGPALDADPSRWRLVMHVEGPDGVEPLASVWRRGANATLPTERVAARALGEGALLAVAEAARVFAPLARCLRGPAPTAVLLSAAEARALGRVYTPRLRALGVSVETPPSWDAWDEVIAPQLVAHPAALGPAKESRFSLDALVRYDWRVALGGVELTLDELEALVARAEPLVRLGDRWVELDGAALAAVVAQLRAHLAADATQQTGARPVTLHGALRALLVEGSGSDSASDSDMERRRLGAATGAFAQTLACLCGETPPHTGGCSARRSGGTVPVRARVDAALIDPRDRSAASTPSRSVTRSHGRRRGIPRYSCERAASTSLTWSRRCSGAGARSLQSADVRVRVPIASLSRQLRRSPVALSG